MGDRERVPLHEEERFPRLLEAFMPPGFGMYVEPGSELVREGAGVRLSLSARLQPSAFMPFEQLSLQQTGPLQRSFSTQERAAHHKIMRLPENWTDQGRGRAVVMESARLYRDIGITTVTLNAVDTGRYAWAMCGFDFADDKNRDYVMNRVQVFANEVLDIGLDLGELQYPWEIAAIEGEVTLAEIAAAGGEEIELPGLLQAKMDAPMRLGKALMLFSDISGWEGVLDLRDEAPGYQQLVNYTVPE